MTVIHLQGLYVVKLSIIAGGEVEVFNVWVSGVSDAQAAIEPAKVVAQHKYGVVDSIRVEEVRPSDGVPAFAELLIAETIRGEQ